MNFLMPPIMPVMQSVSEMKDIISTNDATIQGILIAVIIALGSAIVYLYNKNNKIQEDHVDTIKEFNAELIKVNNSYNEFVRMIENMTR